MRLERLYYGLDTRSDGLWIGCALGVTLSWGGITPLWQARLRSGLKLAGPLAMMLLVLVATRMSWKSASMYYWQFVAVNLSAAVLILDVFFSESSLLKRAFSHPVL